MRNLERTRRGDLLRRVVGGVVVLVVVDLDEDVEAAGEQLAGDRDGGDVAAAAGGALGVEARKGRPGLGPLGGLLEHEADRCRALLGDVAVADGAVGVAHLGVSPAQAHSLRAEGKRVMSPISATRVIAVIRPIPGRAIRAWTRGSGLAWASRSRSKRVIIGVT
jgi:hypothetical protein